MVEEYSRLLNAVHAFFLGDVRKPLLKVQVLPHLALQLTLRIIVLGVVLIFVLRPGNSWRQDATESSLCLAFLLLAFWLLLRTRGHADQKILVQSVLLENCVSELRAVSICVVRANVIRF